MCPFSIEVASEIFIAVDGHVITKHGFEKIQKTGFARTTFRRNQAKNGKYLHWIHQQYLKVVYTKLQLLSKNVVQKYQHLFWIAWLWLVWKRMIAVRKILYFPLIVQMIWHYTKPIISWNGRQKSFAVILFDTLN